MPYDLKVGSRPVFVIVGLALALGLAWAVFGLSGSSVPPAELQGTWTTTTPPYADRALTITDSTVTFHQGEGRRMSYRLVGVRSDVRPGRTDYALEYESGGRTLELSLEYSASGEIRLRNLEHMVWKRES